MKAFCKTCLLVWAIIKRTDPAKILADHFLCGLEKLISSTLSKDPLGVMQSDELRPVYLGNQNSYTKVWVMVAIEVVNREVHLLPMKYQSTTSFIQTLEILQTH